jgi:hypothetical protein
MSATAGVSLKINLIHIYTFSVFVRARACVCVYKSIISLCTKEIPDGALNPIEVSRKTEKKVPMMC